MSTLADSIRRGLQESAAYAKGSARASDYRVHVPEKIDVKRDPDGVGHDAGPVRGVAAARRFAEDLEVEDEIVAEARAGIANAEAGRYVTIVTPKDIEALHERTMARLRDRLAADKG